MGVPQRVLNWIYDVLQGVIHFQIMIDRLLMASQEYQSPDRTYSDVTRMLSHNPNLSLRTSVYSMALPESKSSTADYIDLLLRNNSV